MWKRTLALLSIAALSASMVVGCGGSKPEEKKPDASKPAETKTEAKADLKSLKGTVKVDGSSTVFPLTEAVAEEFRKVAPEVKATVGVSGTGGGMKKFAAGEIDIANASRAMKKEEKEAGEKNNVKAKEMQVAIDAVTVVVSKQNDFVDNLTVEELKKMWSPGSNVKTWKDVRATWPDQPIKLFGAGTDSGTFEYFTEVIVGEAKKSRPDYTASEDDNVLVKGVMNDKYALGYFGLTYYEENKDKLKAVPIDAGKGKGPIAPSVESAVKGDYAPLSRPIFIYVKEDSLKKPEVKEFVKFYVDNMQKLAKQIGMVPVPQDKLNAAKEVVK